MIYKLELKCLSEQVEALLSLFVNKGQAGPSLEGPQQSSLVLVMLSSSELSAGCGRLVGCQ